MAAKQTGWQKSQNLINQVGLGAQLPPDLFKWLKQACAKAFYEKKKANKALVGHLKEEYYITHKTKEFEDFTLRLTTSPVFTNYKKDECKWLNKNIPISLQELWVNFMKKHEFNPPHNHAGIFSFIIFVKIPYKLEEETKKFNDVSTDNNPSYTSRTAFLFPNQRGVIQCLPMEVDKSFEGKIVIFPSKLVHELYPFYTSNGYRKTVSGNIKGMIK